MKTRMFQSVLAVAVVAGFAFLPMNVPAQSSATPQTYGGTDIVKMNKANVGDTTIISYIKSSGNSYNLNADQIIFLKQQGISDAVITAMLSQPNPGAAPATLPMPATPAPQPVASAPAYAQVTSTTVQPAVTYVQAPQPVVTYVQTVPPYYYQPYYYPAPAYGYSGVAFPLSLSFAWGHSGGGGYHGGGWHH
jgi:hypothetical protein